jgi:hypothetical protein
MPSFQFQEARGVKPSRTHNLSTLKAICSTGSPLSPHSYDYVYRDIKVGVRLMPKLSQSLLFLDQEYPFCLRPTSIADAEGLDSFHYSTPPSWVCLRPDSEAVAEGLRRHIWPPLPSRLYGMNVGKVQWHMVWHEMTHWHEWHNLTNNEIDT